MVTAAEEARIAIAEIIQDNLKYLSLFHIEDKQRNIIPFRPLTIQREILAAIHPQGSRNVLLKPSQIGASTCIIGYFLADTLTNPGTTSVIVAYEEFLTQRLLTKAQFMYDQLPDEIKPDMSHKSSHEKYFPAINSVMYIGSARAFTFGRGEVIHNFLADEYAFWPDTARIMVPTLQRVPPYGRVAVLSTPNGEDNDFHDLYVGARDGNSTWSARFWPWWLHEEYWLPPDSNFALPADRGEVELANLDGDEEKLLSLGLTHDQLRWRRAKKAELRELNRRGETELLFEQEFAEDDVSCFLSAGNMVYDLEDVADANLYASKQKPLTIVDRVRVWEDPEPGVRYSLVCDPGMGKQTKTAWAIVKWWEDEGVEKGMVVASYLELLETNDTVDLIIKWAKKYNWATIIPEINNHGVAVLNGLQNNRYPNIWTRVDPVKNRRTTQKGWQTNTKSKPLMIKRLKEVLPHFSIMDVRFASQLRALRYARNSKGDTIIESLGDDDGHDVLAIAAATRETRKVNKGFKGVSGWGMNNSW